MDAAHIQDRLRKGLGVWGGNPVSALSDELVPVVVVDDLTSHDVTSSRVRRYWIGCDTGVPVNDSFVHVYNGDQKTKVIVEYLIQQANTTTRNLWVARNVGIAGTGLVNFGIITLDGGAVPPTTFPGVAQFFQQDLALAMGTVGSIGFEQGVSAAGIALRTVLGFNDRLVISTATVGVATQVAMLITELDPNP